MGASEQQRDSSGMLTLFSEPAILIIVILPQIKLSYNSKINFSDENEFLNGDMLNNNDHIINVECADESSNVDEAFDTSYVAASIATAEYLSKSLNDIYSETIPQTVMRPHSLIFRTDELLCYVSIDRRLS